MTNNFLCLFYCPLEESFRDIFVIHCPLPAEKKDLENTIWQPLGGIVSLEAGGIHSPRDAWNKRWLP